MFDVRDLHVHYHTSRGAVRAVNGVSLDISRGVRFRLVDESGSGKSTIALALLRLIRPPGRIDSSALNAPTWDGRKTLETSEPETRTLTRSTHKPCRKGETCMPAAQGFRATPS